jgi:GT2 family glycosyltransferase
VKLPDNATHAAPEVCAVTVTYGARWHLLGEMLRGLEDNCPEAAEVVIVDNGSAQPVRDMLPARSRLRFHVARTAENEGSAAGFARGLAHALESSRAPLLWLLDDDNRPQPGSLAAALDCYRRVGDSWRNAVLSLRPDRVEYVRAARGIRPIVLEENAALGFHVATAVGRLLHRRRPATTAPGTPVPVAYSPYGGILLHREWIGHIGLPERAFYLYGDDHEYTSRIGRHGGRIFLCAASEVRDLETSWNRTDPGAYTFVAKGIDLQKLYYTVRNRTYWEWRETTGSRPIYLLNLAAFLALLTVRGLRKDRSLPAAARALRVVWAALRDGWRGRLGRVDRAADGR